MAQNIKRNDDPRDTSFIGLLLVGIGIVVFLANLIQSEALGLFILPLLGLAFLGYGFYRRAFGFTIPGCILTGLGVAVLLVANVPTLAGPPAGGIFVIALALAFAAMTLISPYFERKVAWWPLIPGCILGTVGLLLLIGTGEALQVLQLIGIAWPVLLIFFGLYILIAPRERKSH